MDKNFISVYFNFQSFKDSNSKINQVSEVRKEELLPVSNNNLNQELKPEEELEIDQSDNLNQESNPEKVDISDLKKELIHKEESPIDLSSGFSVIWTEK